MSSTNLVKTSVAGVYKRKSEDGETTYYIKYRIGKKQVLERVGTYSSGIREAYCRDLRNEKLHLIRRGETPTLKKSLLFSDILKSYLDYAYTKKDVKHDIYRSKHLSKLLKYPAHSITETMLETILREKEKRLSNTTINHIITLAKSVYNYAIKKGVINKNPLANIKKRKIDNKRVGVLSLEECNELLNTVRYNNDLYLFTLLSIATGARVATVLSIRPMDIDFATRTIRLQNHKVSRGYYAYFDDKVCEILISMIRHIKPYHYVVGNKDKPQDRNTQPKKLQKRLDTLFNIPRGIHKDDRKNKIVAYSLRHSFGSNLANNGVSPFIIKELMDHSSLSMTERYVKPASKIKRNAVSELLNGIMG
ncbi:MAG: site-specific integrase [Helicobacteraceae bacterium]|jgi:site-specific recombinase XerD|nr:site-specific integrase [Helicobacteraceae bacterium]